MGDELYIHAKYRPMLYTLYMYMYCQQCTDRTDCTDNICQCLCCVNIEYTKLRVSNGSFNITCTVLLSKETLITTNLKKKLFENVDSTNYFSILFIISI
jgi:hypothetical protein